MTKAKKLSPTNSESKANLTLEAALQWVLDHPSTDNDIDYKPLYGFIEPEPDPEWLKFYESLCEKRELL